MATPQHTASSYSRCGPCFTTAEHYASECETSQLYPDDGWIDGRMDRQVNGQIHQCINGWIDRKMDKNGTNQVN